MGKAKIAITLDNKIVTRIDQLVKKEAFSNRSQAKETAKLDPENEKAFAEEGIQEDLEKWPTF